MMQEVAHLSGRFKLLAVAAVLAVASVTLTLALRGGSETSDDSPNFRSALEVDHTPGKAASNDQVNLLISNNAGPALPTAGPYAAASVERAWTDEYGAFGFTYPSSLGITYQPDPRTQAQAEKDVQTQIDTDNKQFGSSQFFALDVRDT